MYRLSKEEYFLFLIEPILMMIFSFVVGRKKKNFMSYAQQVGLEYSWALLSAVASLIFASLLRRALVPLRVPSVLCILAAGTIFRLGLGYFDNVTSNFLEITEVVVDTTLAAMGLRIGSHFNLSAIRAARGSLWKFAFVFVPVVVVIVTISAYLIFPGSGVMNVAVGCIALERSSPEALASITESQSSGPFTSATICVAALQDVLALVCFVSALAFAGATSFRQALSDLFVLFLYTLASAVVGVVAVRRLDGRRPIFQAVVLLFILVIFHLVLRTELLLAAIVTGVILNFRSSHPTAAWLESVRETTDVILFTFLGFRINFLAYVSELGGASALFVTRLSALWAGAWIGGHAAGFPSNNDIRWMGLITQLAVALSLVMRIEVIQGHAALARAYGGAVLMALVTGPILLVFALHQAEEVGMVVPVDKS